MARNDALARGQLRWLPVAVLVLVLDQLSKYTAEHWLQPYQPVPVFPGFNWMLAYNEGAAFSFLADAGGWQQWFFALLALGIVVVLVRWMRLMQPREWPLALAASLVIGGAIGNLVDRLLWGHVIDFVDWYVGHYHWPTFNLADAAIVVGALWMALDGWARRETSAVNGEDGS